jgi:UDP-N-acetylenolpyruvoylglucosamine reductase
MGPTENNCIDKAEFYGTLLYNESLSGYTIWRGFKGFNIGGATVSSKHANFIINHQDSATAAEIEALIHLVQTKIREQTIIELMREVLIIGDC